MKAAFFTEDFYLCLSVKDLDLLKKSNKIFGHILYHKNIHECVVEISNTKVISTTFFKSKESSYKFLLTVENFQEILEYGNSTIRIDDANFYVISEKHNPEAYFLHSNILNGQFFMIENENVNNTC